MPEQRPFTARPGAKLKNLKQFDYDEMMRVERLDFADEIIEQDARFDQMEEARLLRNHSKQSTMELMKQKTKKEPGKPTSLAD